MGPARRRPFINAPQSTPLNRQERDGRDQEVFAPRPPPRRQLDQNPMTATPSARRRHRGRPDRLAIKNQIIPDAHYEAPRPDAIWNTSPQSPAARDSLRPVEFFGFAGPTHPLVPPYDGERGGRNNRSDPPAEKGRSGSTRKENDDASLSFISGFRTPNPIRIDRERKPSSRGLNFVHSPNDDYRLEEGLRLRRLARKVTESPGPASRGCFAQALAMARQAVLIRTTAGNLRPPPRPPHPSAFARPGPPTPTYPLRGAVGKTTPPYLPCRRNARPSPSNVVPGSYKGRRPKLCGRSRGVEKSPSLFRPCLSPKGPQRAPRLTLRDSRQKKIVPS